MPSLRLNFIIVATAMLLVGCAKLGNLTAGDKDYASLSAQLKKDMSEKEVSDTIGASPDKFDMVTCGEQTASPWKCKTWVYYGGRAKNTLRVVFYQPNMGGWQVASWQLY